MKTVSVTEARKTWSTLLDQAEAGEDILITRRGKVVARFLPPDDETMRRRAAQDAVDQLLEMRRGVTLGGISIRELIDDGRR